MERKRRLSKINQLNVFALIDFFSFQCKHAMKPKNKLGDISFYQLLRLQLIALKLAPSHHCSHIIFRCGNWLKVKFFN